MTTYRIRPLVWEEVPPNGWTQVRLVAPCPLAGEGNYRVYSTANKSHFFWAKPGQTYGTDCESEEAGRFAAESHWRTRIEQCLDPVTGEQA